MAGLTDSVGAVAGALVGVRRDIHSLQRDVSGLKETTAVLAVAVDDHTHQLAEIKTRLDRIEKKLDRTHV